MNIKAALKTLNDEQNKNCNLPLTWHNLAMILSALAYPIRSDWPNTQKIPDLANTEITYCHFCNGTGMRNKNHNPVVYGRDMKNIMEIITYAYQHGYEDK